MGKNIIGRPEIPPEKMLRNKKTFLLSDIANEALADHCARNNIKEGEFIRDTVLHRLKRGGYKGLDA
jgi:hypothetical protein